MQLLYVSWFGEVGDERHHHSHVDACADGDGEGGEEEGASGGDVGQWEVTFVHRLGRLRSGGKRRETVSVAFSGGDAQEGGDGDPFFRRIIITGYFYHFSVDVQAGGGRKGKGHQ